MTTQSKQAYFNHNNETRRLSHKKQCLAALERESEGLTYKEIAIKTGLSEPRVWKRMSDAELIDGTVYICGSKLQGDSTYSKYKLVAQLDMFPEKRKTFRQWCKEKYPNVVHEFEVLIEMKL